MNRLETKLDLPTDEEGELLSLVGIARVEELGEEMSEDLENYIKKRFNRRARRNATGSVLNP